MAYTVTLDQTHPVSPKHDHVGLFRVAVAFSSETYATPTGVTIDISSVMALMGIAHKNIVAVTGTGAGGQLANFTKTATTGTFTVRLWNGTTEIADGAISPTVTMNVFYNAGSPS